MALRLAYYVWLEKHLSFSSPTWGTGRIHIFWTAFSVQEHFISTVNAIYEPFVGSSFSACYDFSHHCHTYYNNNNTRTIKCLTILVYYGIKQNIADYALQAELLKSSFHTMRNCAQIFITTEARKEIAILLLTRNIPFQLFFNWGQVSRIACGNIRRRLPFVLIGNFFVVSS